MLEGAEPLLLHTGKTIRHEMDSRAVRVISSTQSSSIKQGEGGLFKN